MFNFLRFSWGLKNLQEQNRLSMWTVSQPANQTFIKGLYSHRFSWFFLSGFLLHTSYLIHCAWAESEVWQLFRAWKASEAITLAKKERRKKSEKLSVFTFLSSTSFALQTGFTQEQFPTITFLPERKPKEICPTWSFLMNVLKGNHHQHCIHAIWRKLSWWCVMMIAVWGKFCPKLIY